MKQFHPNAKAWPNGAEQKSDRKYRKSKNMLTMDISNSFHMSWNQNYGKLIEKLITNEQKNRNAGYALIHTKIPVMPNPVTKQCFNYNPMRIAKNTRK